MPSCNCSNKLFLGNIGEEYMLRTEYAYPSSDGERRIISTIWTPENKQNIKAVIQIGHGMKEHVERYAGFAERLTDCGFAVVGNDHMGHGRCAETKDDLGYFTEKEPSEKLVEDMYTMTRKAKEMFRNTPYFIVGHSMGSLVLRRYLMKYGEKIDGAAIVGTTWQDQWRVRLGIFMVDILKLFKGSRYRSEKINSLMNGRVPKKKNKDADINEEQTKKDKYAGDPYGDFVFTLNGFRTLFSTIAYIQKKNNIAKMPKDIPLFIMSGADDPIGGYGKNIQKVYEVFKAAGIQDVQMKLYDGFKHELFKETCCDEAYEDLMEWIESRKKKVVE